MRGLLDLFLIELILQAKLIVGDVTIRLFFPLINCFVLVKEHLPMTPTN
jgi:hypothetical protein